MFDGRFQRFWSSEGRAHDLRRVIALYVVTRCGLGLFVWLTGQHYDCGRAGCLDRGFVPDNFVLNGLFQWDALHYFQVIRRGYYVGEGWDTTAPFFPGFPLLAWLVGRLFGSSLAGGIVLNHLCSIAAAFGIARLCRRLAVGEGDAGARAAVARETSLFWLASPLTLFFCVYLSESLFACLSVALLWAVVAGNFWIVLIAGVLITGTRNAGIAVVGCAALLAFERRRERAVPRSGWLALGLTPLGFLAFVAYQHWKLGDAMAWVTVQERWERHLTTPWRTIADSWAGWPSTKERDVKTMYPVQELLALATTAPLLLLRRRFNIPWAILLLGVLEWLLPLLSHALFSAARYQAGNVYFALAFPALIANRPMLRGVCWMFFGMVIAWYLSTFPFGVWAS